MGATPEDTEREIGQLRGDMDAALAELERRLRGGLRSLSRPAAGALGAGGDGATDGGAGAPDVLAEARENPGLAAVAGVVAVGAVAYGAFAALRALRERNLPQNKLRRQVEGVSSRLGGRLDESRRQIERARRRELLVRLEPRDGGYVRVADARLESLDRTRGRANMVKKLVWAVLLSGFMALGSVVARRVAGGVWRATVREEPPTEKSKTTA